MTKDKPSQFRRRRDYKKHANCYFHKKLVANTENSAMKIKPAMAKQQDGVKQGFLTRFKIAFNLIDLNEPFQHFPAWLKLFNDVNLDKTAESQFTGANASYDSAHFLREALFALASICRADTLVKLHNSSGPIGLLLDESVDVNSHAQLLIFYRICLDGQAVILFGGIEYLPSTTASAITAAIKHRLRKDKVDIRRVMCLGTDGCSTMFGALSGVKYVN